MSKMRVKFDDACLGRESRARRAATISATKRSIVVAACVHLHHHAHVRIGVPAQASDPSVAGGARLLGPPCDPGMTLHVWLLRRCGTARLCLLSLRVANSRPG